MHRLFLGLLAIAVLTNAQAQVLPDSIADKLNKVVEGFKDRYHIPGIAVAFVKGNNIVYEHCLGYTDISRKAEVTIDSRFPIMSVTKTFTATMLMQMAEKGLVNLQDKVTKYVPEYKVKSDYGPVNTTLFQLATHTAGLPRNTPADIAFAESFDRWMLTKGQATVKNFSTDEELLNTLSVIKLDFPPYDFIAQNDRHYSNLGISILGIALQRASKTNYTAYLQNNICKPLNMGNTGCLNEPGAYANIAKGYRYKNSDGSYEVFPQYELNSAIPVGGIYSTVRDLCRYLSFHIGADQYYEKILSAESRAMMRSQRIAWKAIYPYAMHEGSLPGYRSMAVINPVDQYAWVVLTNASEVDFNPLNNAIAEILGAVYKKAMQTSVDQYAGTYKLPNQLGRIDITVKNDTLYSSYLKDILGDAPMIKERGHIFKVNGSNEHSVGYEFIPDAQGKIVGFKMGQITWYKK